MADEETGQPGPTGQPSPEADAVADWHESLPEPLRGEKTFEKFVKDGRLDHGAIAQSYLHLEKRQGSALSIPAEGDEAGWGEVYKKLGRPETPEAYEVKQPTLNVGLTWDADLEREFKGLAHKAGLSSRQVQQIVDFQGAYMNHLSEIQNQGLKASKDEMAKEYGPELPRVQELGKRALLAYDLAHGGELGKLIHKELLPQNPPLLKVLAWLGEQGAEAGFIDGRMDGMLGKEEAAAKLKDLENPNGMKDKNNAYWNAGHPGHQAAVDEAKRLRALSKGLV